MATPKKRTPIVNRSAINAAIDQAGSIVTPHVSIEEGSAKKPGKKRLGRPPLTVDRSERLTIVMTKTTLERFNMAFLQEKMERLRQGEKIDQSLLIENIIKDWMDRHNY